MSERRTSPLVVWISIGIVLALVAYPVSFGPACWLVERGWVEWSVAAALYSPILKMAFDLESEDWLWAYARFCGGETGLTSIFNRGTVPICGGTF